MLSKSKLILLTLLFSVTITNALPIIIHNETDENIFAAIYYYHEDADRATEVKEILPGKTEELEQPSFQFRPTRELVFDNIKDLLKEKLKWKEFRNLPHINVGLPGHYYIAKKDGRLKGYSLTEWHLTKPVKRAISSVTISPIVSQITKKIRTLPIVAENPYKNSNVDAYVGHDLSTDEKNYRTLRLTKIKTALEKLLDKKLDNNYIPEISIVGSGGGYRAMLYLSGFLAAAQELGLFDSLIYQVGLSGSTWAIAYLTQANLEKNLSLKQATENLAQLTTKGFGGDISKEDILSIVGDLYIKWAFGQPITFWDMFGLILGNGLFNEYKNKQMIYFSNFRKLLEKAEWPLPIFTAIAAETIKAEKKIYEFTPYEVYAPWGISVPTWAFGDKFVNGKRTKTNSDGIFAPEQPLSILLGTFGSALAVSVKRFIQEIGKKLITTEEKNNVSGISNKANVNNITKPFVSYANMSTALSRAILEPVIERSVTETSELRISLEFLNFMQGIKESPIKNNKVIKLADAGIGPMGNIPYLPVSGINNRRKQDILIFVDASETIDLSDHDLIKMQNFANKNNLKFPKIDLKNVDKKNISIFKDENDKDCPIVIYMPRIRDDQSIKENADNNSLKDIINSIKDFDIEQCISEGDCTTFNFEYKLENAKKLQKLAEFNLKANIEKIKEEINWVIDQKSSK